VVDWLEGAEFEGLFGLEVEVWERVDGVVCFFVVLGLFFLGGRGGLLEGGS
jgi:hypothetical protein